MAKSTDNQDVQDTPKLETIYLSNAGLATIPKKMTGPNGKDYTEYYYPVHIVSGDDLPEIYQEVKCNTQVQVRPEVAAILRPVMEAQQQGNHG